MRGKTTEPIPDDELRHFDYSEAGSLYILEGWAIATTISTSLRLPVVAAMNAGSLVPVVHAIRAAHRGLSLTVATDDQQGTQNLARHHSRASIPRAATC